LNYDIKGDIECPEDIVLGCLEDYTDLSITGILQLTAECGDISFGYIDNTTQLSDCGDQVITRLWYSDYDQDGEYDMEKDEQVCEQIISLIHEPFDPSSIKWPPHYTGENVDGIIRECESDSTISYDGNISLPEPLSCSDVLESCEPEWLDTDCGLIVLSSETVLITFDPESCFKLVRQWVIIDWCNYVPNQTNSEADEFEWVYDLSYGDCEEGGCLQDSGNVYARYKSYSSDAEYTYNQVIKVFDTEPIEVEEVSIEVCINNNCDASEPITKDVGESTCGKTVSWLVSVFNRDNMQDVIWTESFSNSPSISYTIEGVVPGQYLIQYVIIDGCNNRSITVDSLTLIDCSSPVPLCLESLSTALIDNEGYVDIWASDFNKGSYDNCDSESELIYTFSSTHPDTDSNYESSMQSSFIRISCEGLSGDTILNSGVSGYYPLQVYVWDQHGNYEYCNVRLRVDDTNDICEDISTETSIIAGALYTEEGDAIEFAKVSLSSPEILHDILTETPVDGSYAFTSNPLYQSYTINASRNDDHLNGISTLDVLLVQAHILGNKPFTSPYQVIAADVNNDENISAIDLIELRKLILGVSEEFSKSPSWKFVDAQQTFQDVSKPWPLNDYLLIDGLGSDLDNQDLIGVKMGDVSVNAVANSLMKSRPRSNRPITWHTTDRAFEEGDLIKIPIQNQDLYDVYGFQFTLDHDNLVFERVESENGAVHQGHIGIHDGFITMSWSELSPLQSDAEIFTWVFRAVSDGVLSTAISVNSGKTLNAAYIGDEYEEYFVEISFSEEDPSNTVESYFDLLQNRPNPFSKDTEIGFYVPYAAEGSLVLFDVTGNLVKKYEGTFKRGLNSIHVDRASLNSAGLYFYQLNVGPYSSTRRMILVD
jgi:hypothetical protein